MLDASPNNSANSSSVVATGRSELPTSDSSAESTSEESSYEMSSLSGSSTISYGIAMPWSYACLSGCSVISSGMTASSIWSNTMSLSGDVTRTSGADTSLSSSVEASEDIGFDTIMMKDRRKASRFASFLFMAEISFQVDKVVINNVPIVALVCIKKVKWQDIYN